MCCLACLTESGGGAGLDHGTARSRGNAALLALAREICSWSSQVRSSRAMLSGSGVENDSACVRKLLRTLGLFGLFFDSNEVELSLSDTSKSTTKELKL